MKNLYVQIKTKSGMFDGIYKVVEICGSIIAVTIEGRTTDFKPHEVVKFCNEDGSNYNINLRD